MSIDVSRIRNEYVRSGLSEDDAGDDPIALFDSWMSDAVDAGLHEPTAMALATATPDGRPSVRIVLLKGFDDDGPRFFTNYESRKGDELESNPRAACTMLWHQIERQVRIEGVVARTTPDASDAYFASRPRGSRLGAVASPQSRVVEGRAELDERYAAADAASPDEVERPAYWGGYVVRPETIEFWQGRQSRMHDRIRFRRSPSGWHRERLAP
ncbi:pyridoxamine 5'-phosphate oxidase [Nocardioidaceae bacterium SCSIO 66511]|nr:pyridoxamine 5'-phosphate oxidase [Nocardioidaceae bacterium SCSIO 66511]